MDICNGSPGLDLYESGKCRMHTLAIHSSMWSNDADDVTSNTYAIAHAPAKSKVET